MIDTHCHLTFPDLEGDLDVVLDRAARHGVRAMITVATGSHDAERCLELARRDPRIRCTSGVHPLYSHKPRDLQVIERVARDPLCVAWGELGRDLHYKDPPADAQVQALEEQLSLIKSVDADGIVKPIVVHCRDAFDELLPVLRASGIAGERFVFHCFTAGPDKAQAVLDFGAWISFTGILTFPSAPEVAEAARVVPLDRVMVETDAPYLAPVPHRGARPNQPAWVVHVAGRLAELHGLPLTELEPMLDANASRFFGIDLEALPPCRSAAEAVAAGDARP